MDTLQFLSFIYNIIDNGLDDREAAFKKLNGDNLATSCTNLVSFRQITSEITILNRAIYAANRPQFDGPPLLGTLAFRNKSEYRNLYFCMLIINHVCTSCRNLVRFGS